MRSAKSNERSPNLRTQTIDTGNGEEVLPERLHRSVFVRGRVQRAPEGKRR